MARAVMKLPPGISGKDGPRTMECSGNDVAEALADCAVREPRFKERIFREDGTVWVGVFLNGRNVRQLGGLLTAISDGDEIRLLPPIAGG
jgi:molybdopterin synthase sulfur carrier subunit